MRLTLVAFAVGAALGFARGGRLHRVAAWRFRQPWLLASGVALQAAAALAGGAPWSGPAVLGSYALLLAFAVRNLHLDGLELVAAGLVLNAVCMAANGGLMPVTRPALRAAGATPAEVAEVADAKHRLARPGDRLLLLADTVGVRPLREVVSAGDLAIDAGLVVALPALLGARRRSGRTNRADPARRRRRRYAR